MNDEKRIAILNRFKNRDTCSSNIDLFVRSNFELLISTVLSTRSRNNMVNTVTQNLYRLADDSRKMLNLGYKRIKKYIKKIGLSNTKSRNILKICRILIQKHNGEVPDSREKLESLPGVGRKVSNVVLNVGFGIPTIAVDTHVFRVCNRIGFANFSDPFKLEKWLLQFIPEKFKKRFHYIFFLHGKVICTYNRPLCSCCFIVDLCEFRYKNI
ncbi:endonuclease III domain-containing protein [Candidatus Riesia pediculischaeffi]|uniref:Endonuclease III n=2 Tax=Candidatus Riesia pediculischaeffi TaxID=428411 RepID=A0A1V0HKH5_9ENTR|nr:endonuclease III [Candidatus Riesia pediculischaeffi]ARC53324.1 hypothetical protein AOQ87_01370 [Candidatus Riesia pediculischaeffi]KIE63785.1 Endonuclease III [Candidatus Riesia pediculischaeffi PTSU]